LVSGYLGDSGGPEAPYPPADIFTDFENEPQIKAHMDIRFMYNWRFWTRYTTESHDLIQGTAQKYLLDGEFKNFRQTRFRHFQTARKHESA
jgi:hypothetical protein